MSHYHAMTHLLQLPDELLVHILGYLSDPRDIVSVSQVCHLLHRLAFDRYSLRSITVDLAMLDRALDHCIWWVVEHSISNNAMWHCLVYAVRKGNKTTVQGLIDRGANIRIHDDAPLRIAAMNGHIDIVQLMLDHDSDPNVEDGSALLFAAER